tara:strand:+ start:256 stop:483 length:228 start_codon:yes stop_codon:yes gene_type:complete
MPRLIKFTTDGIIDNVPDMSLAVIEHVSLFYLIDQRVQNKFNKFVAFAVAGSLYEMLIADLKSKDVSGTPQKYSK